MNGPRYCFLQLSLPVIADSIIVRKVFFYIFYLITRQHLAQKWKNFVTRRFTATRKWTIIAMRGDNEGGEWKKKNEKRLGRSGKGTRILNKDTSIKCMLCLVVSLYQIMIYTLIGQFWHFLLTGQEMQFRGASRVVIESRNRVWFRLE